MIVLPTLSALARPGQAGLTIPVESTRPFWTGITTEGQILTANIGIWVPTPAFANVKWRRNGAYIDGNASQSFTYLLTSADVGAAIDFEVTLGNSAGTVVRTSLPTPPIKAAAPPNTAPTFNAPPRLVGSPVVGSNISVFGGQVTGYPAPTLVLEIFADTTSRGTIADGGIYIPTTADVGKTLTVVQTATNIVNAATSTSNALGPVASLGPAPQFMLGLNFSGMEYSNSEADIDLYAITIPDSQLQEAKDKGFDHIRACLKWDRIERTRARGVLDPVNWGNVLDLLVRCRTIGLKVILDIHNFGARVVQQDKTTTPVNATNFLNTGWTHYGATDAADGFLEDNSNGDHDLKYDWTAEGAGTATITVVAKANPAYTGNGSYKINLLGVGQEVGFRIADGVKFSGNAPNGTWSSSGPDVDGYRTFTMTYPVSAAGTQTVNIGAGATTGDYAGNHYQGVTGQKPLLIKSIRVDATSSQQYYRGIGETFPDGTPALPPSDQALIWSLMVTDVRARGLEDVILGYDTQNEPNSVLNEAVLYQAQQLTINAIRATGSTKIIFVEGKPYSGAVTFPEVNPNLWTLEDPANNLIFSGHTYGDYDSSGAATGLPMTWAVQGGRKVEIPVDPVGNPNEVVDEMTLVRRNDHMLQWLKSKGINRMHMGEGGVGRDSIHWNNQVRNLLTWAQANKVIITLWAGGGLGDYYELGWSAYSDGLQREQMAVIDELKGNPVPTYYRVTVPTRIADGETTIPIEIKYNGLIPSPITFTPSDNGAGGSFSPSTITTDVSENWVGTVTYTPAANVNGTISVANDKGWPTPAAKPFSSYADVFTPIEAESVQVNRVFSIYRRLYKSYTGPLIRLWKQVGGGVVEQDFGRATGLETLDTTAVTAWIAGADGGVIKVSKIYDQGPSASLTGRNNIQARLDTEGGWPAPSSADYPLWINDAGDGKPVARWTGTGTSSMDFSDSMLQRSNMCVVGLVKHNSGWNDFNWQFNHKLLAFPSYVCDQDGASYSYSQQSGIWSHFIAGRTRNSSTGTVGWLNGQEAFVGPTLDNTIQVNPDGAHGPDYRDTCQMGYYRFTPGANLGGFDFRELSTFNAVPSDTQKTALWTDANTTFGVAVAQPVLIDPYVPTFSIDFLTGKEYHNGVEVPAGTYWSGGKTLDDPLKGMQFTTSTQGKGIIGAMRDAVFSDAFTFRMSVNDFVGAGSGGVRLNVLTRDGTPWIYNYFARLNGHITTNDVYPSNLDYPLPAGAVITYSGTDQTIVISRGKGRKITVSGLPNSTAGISQHDASNDPPLAAPSILQIGDSSVGGTTTFTGYISRIDVWDGDIQDIRQISLICNKGSRYGYVKGTPLSEWHNGQNLSGMENYPPAGPFEQEIDYYSGLDGSPLNPGFGVDFYRLPFSPDSLWDHWRAYILDHTQPFPTAANTTVATMNPTVKAQIQRLITYAQARQKIVLLDWHGYGGPMGKSLGGTFPDDLFAAVWTAVATVWNGPYVHYDLQNEPVGAASPTGLATTYQAAVTAIRAIPAATGDIHLAPSDNYSKPFNFDIYQWANAAGDAMLAVTDPLDKLVYHIHFYFDASGSGTGYTKWLSLTALTGAVDWARKNGKRLFIGEWGATYDAANNPGNDQEGRWLNWYMYQNNDVILGHAIWGGGIYWYEGYWTWTWPKNWNTPQQTDRSQMSYLKLYPGTGYVAPSIPTGTPTITLGTETDVSVLAGAVVNTYQTDLRVDPTNANRQVITGKYGNDSTSSENTAVALVTNDRWTTATATVQNAVGDPDSVFDKDGNALWSFLDRGAGTTLGVRRKLAGSTSWGSIVNAMAARPDHPFIICDLWPTSPYYNRMYATGTTPKPNFSRSLDGGLTWGGDFNISGFDQGNTRTSNPLMFGGCVAKTGEVFFSCRTGARTLIVNGSYGGSVYDIYVIRSTDGGATWTQVKLSTVTAQAALGPGGRYFGASNVAYTPPTAALPNGRLHVTTNWQPSNGAAAGSMYQTSDDLGLTWSQAGTFLAYDNAQSHLCGCFSATQSGMLVYTYMTGNGSVNRMYAIASRDSGATWSSPVKVNSTDWTEPSASIEAREPSGDQVYAGVALSDGTFEVCWPQNVGGIYHAFRRKLTVV